MTIDQGQIESINDSLKTINNSLLALSEFLSSGDLCVNVPTGIYVNNGPFNPVSVFVVDPVP